MSATVPQTPTDDPPTKTGVFPSVIVIPPDDSDADSLRSVTPPNDRMDQPHPAVRHSLSQPEFGSKGAPTTQDSTAKRKTHSPSESSMDSNRSGGKLDWRKHYWEMSSGAAPKQDKHKRLAATFSAASAQTRGEHGKRWNVFRSIPRNQDMFEPQWTLLAAQVFKIVAYLIMSGLVLGCGIIAKVCLLTMTSSLRSGLYYTPCTRNGHLSSFVSEPQERVPENAIAWFYWYIWVALIIPEIFTFCRSIRLALFKYVPKPTIYLFMVPFVIESLQTIGVCLFVYAVLPNLDSVRGVMLTCGTATFPLLLSAISQAGSSHSKRSAFVFFDVFAFFCHITVLWVWSALDRKHIRDAFFIPLSLLLISLGWWENFVTKSSSIAFVKQLGHLKERLQRCRYKIYLLITLWKIILSFFCMVMAAGANHRVSMLFELHSPFENYNVTITADHLAHSYDYSWEVFKIFLWFVITSLVCYEVAKYACKVKMERFSYAIPVALIIPCSVITVIAMCESKRRVPCYYAGWISDKMFPNCNYGNTVGELFSDRIAWAWILWFSSYLWLVSHIFTQKPSRLSRTDTLFILPYYSGLFVDQSLALNRRRQNATRVRTKDLNGDDEYATDESVATEGTDLSIANSLTSLSLGNSNADTLTKIYICGTMWHETPTEMVQMLKSIMRMDEDQSARKNAQKYLKIVDPDFYELETHVFFDDAWEMSDEHGFPVPNEYVRQFVAVIDEAASAVHGINMTLKPPVKFDIQYGGRLVWTLPGDTRLFVHLKDKTKIRVKKRWSQVMYMYYLLGHRIMELISDVGRKQLLADNTYILAIDGDSKFSPYAVQKLVDLMKKNQKLGSACGRIHPIGSGYLVWYQKFEYAIAHWFQKAAEHVFGCVLCSPGCFSLFRGSALMDDNVMNKYTKVAEQPRHFVQYDQGEDRWLSTLLLKQGYRIEYAAAADAETYAPEGFDEFFNQRRRWTPSSVANTLDLLADYKRAVTNNDSISKMYIFYQMIVILFSMLGPAIIFTMMVFAQVAAFRMDSLTVLLCNLIPVMVFITVCFVASSKAQLGLARLLSIVYAFIMMAVLVGTGIQIVSEGLESPVAVFVVALAGIFCAAAFFHPKEFYNIFHGAVFFLCIPCTYVILSLYSLINLNVINWGTREAAQKAAGKGSETKLQQWMKKLSRARGGDATGDAERVPNSGGFLCSCERICKCALCPDDDRYDRKPDEMYLWMGTHMEKMAGKVEKIDEKVDELRHRRISGTAGILSRLTPLSGTDIRETGQADAEVPEIQITQATPGKSRPKLAAAELQANATLDTVATSVQVPPGMSAIDSGRFRLPGGFGDASPPESPSSPFGSIDSLLDDGEGALNGSRIFESDTSVEKGPGWLYTKEFSAGPNDILDEIESQFWTDLIDEYLKPIAKDPVKEAESAAALKSLRNSIAFGLLCVNGLLVLVIYLLQLNKELLSIKWDPTGNYSIMKFNPGTGLYVEVYEPLKIEPIGFTIIMFLSFILLIQTAGMFLHRFHTVSHILSSTILPCFRSRRGLNVDGDELLEENAIEIAKNLQKLTEDGEEPAKSARVRRKRIVFDIERGRRKPEKSKGLHQAFQRRFFTFNPEKHRKSLKGVHLDKGSVFSSGSAQKATADAIRKRRDSLLRESADRQQRKMTGTVELMNPAVNASPSGAANISMKLDYEASSPVLSNRSQIQGVRSKLKGKTVSFLNELHHIFEAKQSTSGHVSDHL